VAGDPFSYRPVLGGPHSWRSFSTLAAFRDAIEFGDRAWAECALEAMFIEFPTLDSDEDKWETGFEEGW